MNNIYKKGTKSLFPLLSLSRVKQIYQSLEAYYEENEKTDIQAIRSSKFGGSKPVLHSIPFQKNQISFSIRQADKIYFVAVESIACIYLDAQSVYLLDFDGEKHFVQKTLDAIEEVLSEQQFYRINRQIIINRKAIKDLVTYTNQRIVVQLTVSTPEIALVPRLKVTQFLNWVEVGKPNE